MDITIESTSEPTDEEDLVRARRTVARHATSAQDAHALLAMLGLLPGDNTVDDQNRTIAQLEFLRDGRHRSGQPCIGCGKTTGTPEQVETGQAEVRYASLGYCKKCRAELRRIEMRLS